MFVKVCGTTSEADALLAVALGADAIGFVFAPSPRQIAPQLAGDIAKRLPREVLTVGVFRNETPQRVVKIVNTYGFKAAQLHGQESLEAVQWVSERVPVTIRAFVAGSRALARAAQYDPEVVLLLDSESPGSGKVFDWRLAEGVAQSQRRLMISGGLDPTNVADAIGHVHPWGVDVVSGVEQEPGRKDPKRLREFIVAARRAEPPVYEGGEYMPFDWQVEG